MTLVLEPGDTLTIAVEEAISASPLTALASYGDHGTTFVEGSSTALVADASVVLVSAASDPRIVRSVFVHNADDVTHLVTITHHRGATATVVISRQLGSLDSLDLVTTTNVLSHNTLIARDVNPAHPAAAIDTSGLTTNRYGRVGATTWEDGLISDDGATVSVLGDLSLGGNALLNATVAWGLLTGTPTTLAGYGITDGALDADLTAHVADTDGVHGIADTALLLVDGDIGTDVQEHGDVLDDLNTLGAVASDGQFLVGTGAGAFAYESGATARTSLGLAIGTDVQAHGDVLDDLNTLGAVASDGQFLVGTGAGTFAYESGATARTSLGLGIGDSPTFASVGVDGGITLSGDTISGNGTTVTVDDKLAVNDSLAVAQYFAIDSPDTSSESVIFLRSDGVDRWCISKTDEAETGSNEGSNFRICRHADGGAREDSPISISRATGNVLLADTLDLDDFLNFKNYDKGIFWNDAFTDGIWYPSAGNLSVRVGAMSPLIEATSSEVTVDGDGSFTGDFEVEGTLSADTLDSVSAGGITVGDDLALASGKGITNAGGTPDIGSSGNKFGTGYFTSISLDGSDVETSLDDRPTFSHFIDESTGLRAVDFGAPGDYTKEVIALCELDNDDITLESWSRGTISLHSVSGYLASVVINFCFQKQRNATNAYATLSKTGAYADPVRPCTFTYNGTKYGGIEYYLSSSQHSRQYCTYVGPFTPFRLAYYNVNTSTALIPEVNSSLVIDGADILEYGDRYFNGDVWCENLYNRGDTPDIGSSGNKFGTGYFTEINLGGSNLTSLQGGTANTLQKADGSDGLSDSSITDDGSDVEISVPVTVFGNTSSEYATIGADGAGAWTYYDNGVDDFSVGVYQDVNFPSGLLIAAGDHAAYTAIPHYAFDSSEFHLDTSINLHHSGWLLGRTYAKIHEGDPGAFDYDTSLDVPEMVFRMADADSPVDPADGGGVKFVLGSGENGGDDGVFAVEGGDVELGTDVDLTLSSSGTLRTDTLDSVSSSGISVDDDLELASGIDLSLSSTGTLETDTIDSASGSGITFDDDLELASGKSVDCATNGGYFKPRRLSQSAQPTPETGEMLVWRDSDDNKTYLLYNDSDEGARKVELT
jgi:hypothetical protein